MSTLSNSNCKVFNTCDDGTSCSSHGNCYYNIFDMYRVNGSSNTTCVCHKGYSSRSTDTIKCCYKQKSQMVAFWLEFIVSFGSGHFYIKSYLHGAMKLVIVLIIVIFSIASFLVIIFSKKSGYSKKIDDLGEREKERMEDEAREKKFNMIKLAIKILVSLVFIYQLVDIILFGINFYKDGNGIMLDSW